MTGSTAGSGVGVTGSTIGSGVGVTGSVVGVTGSTTWSIIGVTLSTVGSVAEVSVGSAESVVAGFGSATEVTGSLVPSPTEVPAPPEDVWLATVPAVESVVPPTVEPAVAESVVAVLGSTAC